jgi:hypothetical protein
MLTDVGSKATQRPLGILDFNIWSPSTAGVHIHITGCDCRLECRPVHELVVSSIVQVRVLNIYLEWSVGIVDHTSSKEADSSAELRVRLKDLTTTNS